MTIHLLQQKAASLLLYQSVLKNSVGEAFLDLLQALHEGNAVQSLHAYGVWFKTIAATGKSWQDVLVQEILWDDNPFTQQVQKISLEQLPPALISAAKHDLQCLESLYNCGVEQLGHWLRGVCQLSQAPVIWHCDNHPQLFLHSVENWANALPELASYYQQQGTGLLGRYRALRWGNGKLQGITTPDPIQLHEIVGYEEQKEILLNNTKSLLSGYRALNVLLYGSRGTGKSSLVKGLLNGLGDRGLRLVEVPKSDLQDLPAIVEQLRNIPQKFIIFVDDLSFEEDDETFKALKVVLEGSVTARADNVVVYATSNRRHLVREFFSDRPRPSQADEIHTWDSMQEKLSFSDRFGLTLTFEPPNQDTYLKIVRHLAKIAQIPLSPEDLDFQAKQWATRHNGRSGRTARQFVDWVIGNG